MTNPRGGPLDFGEKLAQHEEAIRKLNRHDHGPVAMPDLTGAGGPYAISVAASNTITELKSRADFICSGTKDEETIMRAFLSVARMGGGAVHLMDGDYQIADTILGPSSADFTAAIGSLPANGIGLALRGSGPRTVLHGLAGVMTVLSFPTAGPNIPLHIQDFAVDAIEEAVCVHAESYSYSIFRGLFLNAAGGGDASVLHVVGCDFSITSDIVVDNGHLLFEGSPEIIVANCNVDSGFISCSDQSEFTVTNCRADAIYVDSCSQYALVSNQLEHWDNTTRTSFVITSSGDGVISGNSFEGAIHLTSSGNCVISDNSSSPTGVFDHLTGHIVLNSSPVCLVHDNILDDRWRIGIELNTSSNCSIQGNWYDGLVGADLSSGSDDNIVCNNHFLGAATGVVDAGTNNVVCTDGGAGGGGSGREYATIVIAADDTHQEGKDGANYLSTTDLGTTLATALAALPTINGKKRGRVVLLEGTYEIATAVTIDENYEDLEIRGVGWGTRLVAQAGLTDKVFEVFDTTVASTIENITIADMLIDCEDRAVSAVLAGSYGAGAATIDGLYLRNLRIEDSRGWATQPYAIYTTAVSNVYVEDSAIVGTNTTNHKGVYGGGTVRRNYISGVDVAILFGTYVDENNIGTVRTAGIQGGIYVRGNSIDNVTAGRGIEMGASYGLCEGNTINSVEGGHGIYLASMDNVRILGNHVGFVEDGFACYYVADGSEGPVIAMNSCDSPGGEGIRCLADNATIVGNLLDWTQAHGIVLEDASDCQVHDNKINQFTGSNSPDTYSGILIDGNSDRNSVQGNHIRSEHFKYGIRVDDSTCNDNLVTNNDLLNSAITAAFSDAGTGTVTTAGNRT